MQPYTGFASVYDVFMDYIPYDDWAVYVKHLLEQSKINSGLVLELGCGTGTMTRKMAELGFDMIGIDKSEEMLTVAREMSEGKEDGILYLCQDMREFELYGTVAAVICVCDSINYMLSEEDLLKVFRLVNNYLDPNGLLIFDMDTPYAYENVMGDSTMAVHRNEGSFIWENTFYKDEMMNEVSLTMFIREEDDLYRKYEETHLRKAYPVERIRQLIEEAGMEWVAAYHEMTEEKPRKDSERIYIVAREKHQSNKLYL